MKLKILDAVDNRLDERREKRKTAEDLFSSAIKIRDNFTCRKCGTSGVVMETAHFITRGNKKVQFEFNNGFTLCKYNCHIWAHKKRIEFEEWVKLQLGDKKFYSLVQLANSIWKETAEFYDEKIIELRAYIKKNKR
ncbi:MAG: hypothetical protein IPK06_04765 [Ignavibacteriae bacterium]|nr:hypothetical protein [Ignavibacteriota bacterium]